MCNIKLDIKGLKTNVRYHSQTYTFNPTVEHTGLLFHVSMEKCAFVISKIPWRTRNLKLTIFFHMKN